MIVTISRNEIIQTYIFSVIAKHEVTLEPSTTVSNLYSTLVSTQLCFDGPDRTN